jgi:hypothetical protein
MEQNLDYFTIERSSDGISFVEFGLISVKSYNSSSTMRYEYIDEMPFMGLSYYRLKATDFDGSIGYHGILAVNLDATFPEILIYRNPSTDNGVKASFSGKQQTSFRIFTLTGEIVHEGILNPGFNHILFKHALKSGVYFLRVEDPAVNPKKFIVK